MAVKGPSYLTSRTARESLLTHPLTAQSFEQRIDRADSLYRAACSCALAGDTSRALDYLQQAADKAAVGLGPIEPYLERFGIEWTVPQQERPTEEEEEDGPSSHPATR